MTRRLASQSPPAMMARGIKKMRMPTAIFFEIMITSVVVIIESVWF